MSRCYQMVRYVRGSNHFRICPKRSAVDYKPVSGHDHFIKIAISDYFPYCSGLIGVHGRIRIAGYKCYGNSEFSEHVCHCLGSTSSPDNQRVPDIRPEQRPEALCESEPVAVEAFEFSVANPDYVHRADLPGIVRQRIKVGENTFLVRDGDIKPHKPGM